MGAMKFEGQIAELEQAEELREDWLKLESASRSTMFRSSCWIESCWRAVPTENTFYVFRMRNRTSSEIAALVLVRD